MPALIALSLSLLTVAAAGQEQQQVLKGQGAFGDYTTDAPGVRRLITPADLPAPGATKSVDNGPKLVKRPQDAWPKAPAGFVVELFAEGLQNPRKIIAAPNGDLFVAESNPGRVKIIRPLPDGRPADVSVFAEKLTKPFGIAFYPPGPNPTHVYIANTGSVVRFAYKIGDLKATGEPEMIVPDLPGGGQLRGGGHWTRDVLFTPDGQKMFVSVGSKSNNDDNPEQEKNRATVLQYNPDGKEFRVFATGIRNAVGLAIEPKTGVLWGSVNERDAIGDDLVPDYVTSIQEGGFYGWPWSYIGKNQDPRNVGKKPELAERVIVPDVLLQSHSASLCMLFYTGQQFPQQYRGDAFAAEHGSWNRARRTGYKVIRVPMKEGKATGEYEDFMTGFVDKDGNVWGRPVGVAQGADGSMYVSDDGGNVIWRVRYGG
jgi:glucose/arabinose dehydrogenase